MSTKIRTEEEKLAHREKKKARQLKRAKKFSKLSWDNPDFAEWKKTLKNGTRLTRKEKLKALYEELESIRNDTHSRLLQQYAKIDERTQWQDKMEDLDDLLVTEQLNKELAAKTAELERERDKRTQEMVMELLQDYDKDLKKVESYVLTLDITRPHHEMPTEAAKKALRLANANPPRKTNEQTSSRNLPVHQPLSMILPSFLLKDTEIAEDMKYFGFDSKGSPVKNTRVVDAAFTKSKFTYDGKMYKTGEEVSVENREYGKIPAKIEAITEEVVTFKSCYTWDVRQIHASYSDLQEGRVVVHKKRNN